MEFSIADRNNEKKEEKIQRQNEAKQKFQMKIYSFFVPFR